jgi:hypothetical protein
MTAKRRSRRAVVRPWDTPLEGQVGLHQAGRRFQLRCSDCSVEFQGNRLTIPIVVTRLTWHLCRGHRLNLAEAAQLIAESSSY